MFYESIYQKKDETEPDKYAESNYGGDNSPAYFRRKEKQRKHSRNYKNREKQINPYLFNNLYLNE